MNEIEKLTQVLRDNEDLSFAGIKILKMIEDVYKKQLVGNVPKANASSQLYEGWRDRSDKSYYNEKRILIFTPCYEDITMRWRLIDSQFMDLCTEASHWKKLDEPAFV